MTSPPKSPTRPSRFIEADLSTQDQTTSDLLFHILSEQDQNESRRRSASNSSTSSYVSAEPSNRRASSGSMRQAENNYGLTYCSPGYNSTAAHDYQMMSTPDIHQEERHQSTGEKIKGRLRALTLGKGESKAQTLGTFEHKHSQAHRHG